MSGRNFISKDFEVVCIEHGTENTPQDIGLAECTNGIVVTMTKYMLKAQKIVLDINGGKCSLYTTSMSNEGLVLFYTQRNVK